MECDFIHIGEGTMSRIRNIVMLCVWMVGVTLVYAGEIVVPLADRGMVSDQGTCNFHYKSALAGRDHGIYRNFFVFDLKQLSSQQVVTAATVIMEHPAWGYSSPDGHETFVLHAVNLDIENISSNLLYGALASGPEIGRGTVSNTIAATTLSIPVNAAGIEFLTQCRGGTATFGGEVVSLTDESDVTECLFRFVNPKTLGPGDNRIVLQFLDSAP